MEDTQYQLIAEQLGRMKDNIESRFKRLETAQEHNCALEKERLDAIKAEIQDLKDITKDHENRLRSNTDNITTHKTTLSIAQALQVTLTLIASAAAAWLGSSLPGSGRGKPCPYGRWLNRKVPQEGLEPPT